MIAIGLWVDTGATTRHLGRRATTRAGFASLGRWANRRAVTTVIFVGVGVETHAAAGLFIAGSTARRANTAVTRHAVATAVAACAAVIWIGLQIGANSTTGCFRG